MLDETAELKKGRMTVGVARQHAGITGQVENCQTVVNCAYVTGRGHALFNFRLYLPRDWCEDEARRTRAQVPADVEFATKTELGTQMITDAIGRGVRFGWAAADEVYGRSAKLREACERAGKGYVLAVPRDFKVRLHPRRGKIRADAAARRMPAAGWETRSCGRGCKGHRDYRWAWLATASSRHWLLLRRSITDPADLAYFWCHVPAGRPVSLPLLIKVCGSRWPVEECHQQAKGQASFDAHQVRLWQSFHRHTVLSICALALLAVAAARPQAAPLTPGAATGGTATGAAGQPADWADTGILPASPDEPPPEDPGLVKVSVPEARRLLRLATTPMNAAARQLGYAWSRWRRKHQARARYHHYQARLQASPA